MSRRSRIKNGSRSKEKFTLAHHSQYASTTTYFPRAYSHSGDDIVFPISVLPLYSSGKITYAGTSQDFFHRLAGVTFADEEIRLVSISLSGEQYQGSSRCANMTVMVCSLICFCMHWVLSTSIYRRTRFPKYRFEDYRTLLRIIERFQEVETLIINFQDNDLTPQKLAMLDETCARTRVRTLVLRNLTYFIEVPDIDEAFPLMRKKEDVDFKFIWEKYVLVSEKREGEEEDDKLLCDQF